MVHKNREKRAAKRAREAEKNKYYDDEYDDVYDDDDYYDDEYYDDEFYDDDDYYDDEPRRRRGAHPAIVAGIVTFLLLFGGFYGVQKYYENSLKPIDPGNTNAVLFVVLEGATASDIALRLKESGLIKSEYLFRFHLKFTEFDKPFQFGEHYLSKSMSVEEILEVLTEVAAVASTKTFTIIEGYNIEQIARSLSEQGIMDESDFYDVVQNGDFGHYPFLADCPGGYDRLEGFLYPETYEIFEDAEPYEIVDKMLQQFDYLFMPEYYDIASEMGMTVREIVTMASIVEKESVVADERPTMAGVFYNRIEQGMLLQSCATIQYILGEPKNPLLNEDLEIQHPYNTYIHEGLPPGPICSPRIEAIQAALFPDENEYIYFVLSDALDGTHKFSVDYDEFLANKDAYYRAFEGE